MVRGARRPARNWTGSAHDTSVSRDRSPFDLQDSTSRERPPSRRTPWRRRSRPIKSLPSMARAENRTKSRSVRPLTEPTSEERRDGNFVRFHDVCPSSPDLSVFLKSHIRSRSAIHVPLHRRGAVGNRTWTPMVGRVWFRFPGQESAHARPAPSELHVRLFI